MKKAYQNGVLITYQTDEEFRMRTISALKGSSFEHFFPLDSDLGEGGMQSIQMRRGLVFFNTQFRSYDEKYIIGSKTMQGLFKIGFNLSDKALTASIEGSKDAFTGEPGGAFVFTPSTGVLIEIPPHTRFTCVCVLADPSLLYTLLEEHELKMNPALYKRIVEAAGDPFCHKTHYTPAMRIVLEQIMRCPYSGSLKRFYLEGKALELITLRLAQLDSAGRQGRAPLRLSRSEIERLHMAREVVKAHMVDPPTLSDLSRAVAINLTKLKAGFRELFGTSVFGYVRELRLEMARALLEECSATVTQAALESGYHSISHFALAFKKRFAINPNLFIRSKRLV